MCFSRIWREWFLRIHDLDVVIFVNLPIFDRSPDLSPADVNV